MYVWEQKIEILEPHHQRTRLSSLLHLGRDEEAEASHDEDPIERAVRRVQVGGGRED